MNTTNAEKSISLGEARRRAIADTEAAEQRRRDAVDTEAAFYTASEEPEDIYPDVEIPLTTAQLLAAYRLLFKPVTLEETDLPEEAMEENSDVQML